MFKYRGFFEIFQPLPSFWTGVSSSRFSKSPPKFSKENLGEQKLVQKFGRASRKKTVGVRFELTRVFLPAAFRERYLSQFGAPHQKYGPDRSRTGDLLRATQTL